MIEDKKDYVSVTLPTGGSESQNSRRSIRRYWNQLPRCQRNIILLGITAILVTLLFYLPNNNYDTENNKIDNEENHNINIAPFNINNGNNHQRLQVNKNSKKVTKYDNILTYAVTAVINKIQNKIPPPIENNNIINDEKNKNSNYIEKPDDDIIDKSDKQLIEKVQHKTLVQPAIDEVLNHLEKNSNNSLGKDFKGPSNDRQKAVVNAFKHSWKNYKEFAWGHDNLKPLSMSSHDWFGLGLTIVDALDTLYIMDLQEEFDEARSWVDQFLLFDIQRDVNLFEVTIRVLGGLLSTYHLSGDIMFLKKSIELGNRLLPCFETPSGIPYSDINLGTMTAHSPKWSPDSSTSEVTTLQLEFRDLSRSTGNNIYEEVVHRVNEKIHSLEKTYGLVPIFINANTGHFRNFATISLGARGDSYYEYLLKQWIQTGRKENDFLINDYKTAIDGVFKHLVRKTPKEHHTYVGELFNGKEFKPKMDHLTCYLPGTLILGHKYNMPDFHLILANELLETCYQTYMKQPTGLAPEITYFNTQSNTQGGIAPPSQDNEGGIPSLSEPDIQVKSNDAHNLLRPEFIESLYYFYVITGNRTYQDMGWNIFLSFEKYTKVKNGYTSIGNVKNIFNTRPRDMMESFWLGETLKYFYLLFSDDRNEIDLEKYVFNTEAHPLPIRKN